MNQDNPQAKSEIQSAGRTLLKGLGGVEPTIPREFQRRIAALGEVAAKGRTHLPRSGYTREMLYTPDAESNTRIAQELAQLAKGAASLDGRREVGEEDLALVYRAAFDSMPPLRKTILETLMKGGNPRDLKPKVTVHYVLEDLEVVGLVEQGEKKGPVELSELAQEMLREAKLMPWSLVHEKYPPVAEAPNLTHYYGGTFRERLKRGPAQALAHLG